MAVASLALGACGDGMADTIAVEVANKPITRATVTHWMSVIAGEVSVKAGQPEPPVPDPPRYAACIDYRRTHPSTYSTGSTDAATMKVECAHEYLKEKLKALYTVIPADWVSGQAAEVGVRLSRRELDEQVARYAQQFPSQAQLRRVLVGTRGTAADLRARIEVLVLTAEVQRKLEAKNSGLSAQQRQQALNAFGETFVQRWTARTECRSQYMVALCRRYKPPRKPTGLVPPEIPLTGMTAA